MTVAFNAARLCSWIRWAEERASLLAAKRRRLALWHCEVGWRWARIAALVSGGGWTCVGCVALAPDFWRALRRPRVL